MKFKGTPGPWRIAPMGPNGCPVIGNNEVMVSMLAHSVNEEWQATEAMANAWLISAAPDLLYSLQKLLTEYKFTRSQFNGDTEEDLVDVLCVRNAMAAISKALGGNQ